MTVYSDVFRLGEGYIQRSGKYHDNKGNPLVYMRNDGASSGKYRILLEDTFEETLKEAQNADFAIINGLSYYGRRNVSAAARYMFALIFDLDGVTDKNLNNFMSGAKGGAYPVPNYIALSGHGVHLYFLFNRPVPLYPEMKTQLKEMKYRLTLRMWNPYTSEDDSPQLQGINQGFRPVGGKTKLPGIRVRAFRVSGQRFTVSQLAERVGLQIREPEKKKTLTLEEARQKYPLWYQKRIVENDQSKGHWTCKRDLYDWWKRQIWTGATLHHRYFSIMCLAVFAIKSGISAEELKKDAYDLIPLLNNIAPEEPFTEADVESALECYDERFYTFPRNDISRLSAIPILANKRNGRKQADHVKLMNLIRDEINHNTTWNREGNGRRPKGDLVKEWQRSHPDGRKADCIRDTGLSKPTVYKYWTP